MQAKLDAQSQILQALAERIGVDADTAVLSRLVGVEDAPEHVIKKDQSEVRRSSVAPRSARQAVGE
jgi:hypothetical protein